MTRTVHVRRAVIAAGLLLAAALPAPAQPTFVTSQSQLQADGVVNWSVLGPTFTPMQGGYAGAFPSVAGVPNTSLIITGPDSIFGDYQRRDQGLGWSGSFQPSEALIWSVVDGSIRIDFLNTTTGAPAPVAGFGARYEDAKFGPFSGRVRAYDVSDVLIATFDFAGTSQNPATPGANPFVGILSDQSNIAYLYYDYLTFSGNFATSGFALGTLYVQSDLVPVPEPAAGLAVAALALAAGRRLRRWSP